MYKCSRKTFSTQGKKKTFLKILPNIYKNDKNCKKNLSHASRVYNFFQDSVWVIYEEKSLRRDVNKPLNHLPFPLLGYIFYLWATYRKVFFLSFVFILFYFIYPFIQVFFYCLEIYKGYSFYTLYVQ